MKKTLLILVLITLWLSPVEAQTKRKVVFGVPVTPPNVVHIPPYVAKDMGFFAEYGIDVELVTFEGGTQTVRGSVAGGSTLPGPVLIPLLLALPEAPAPKWLEPIPTNCRSQCWFRVISKAAKISKDAKSAFRRSEHFLKC